MSPNEGTINHSKDYLESPQTTEKIRILLLKEPCRNYRDTTGNTHKMRVLLRVLAIESANGTHKQVKVTVWPGKSIS